MTKTFTPKDFDRLAAQRAEIAEFKEFALDRFRVYGALATPAVDVDAAIKQGGGYVTFSVNEHSLFGAGDITFDKYTANDRGPGDHRAYTMPREALFTITDNEQDFAKYLELRERFEK